MRTKIGAQEPREPNHRLPDIRLEFTGREIQIIRLIAEEQPVEEIARQLGISAQTVRNHGVSIRRKAEAFRRLDAMRWPWQRDEDAPTKA